MKKIINLLSILIFFIIIFVSLFYNNATIYGNYKFYILIPTIVFIYMILKLLYKFICTLSEKQIKNISYFIFFIVFISQLIISYFLKVHPSWDFGVIFNEAIDFGNEYNYSHTYFSYYPNNIPILIILKSIFFIINLIIKNINYIYVGILLNIIIIDFSMFILYKCVKKIYNLKMALFSIILFALFSPIYLYCPIFYTDTFTMFIPILLLYLFSFKDDKLSKKETILILIIFSIILFVGMQLKITTNIIFIAILIASLLYKNNKLNYKKILNISLVTLVTLLTLFIFKNILYNRYIYDKIDVNKKIPYTHWIAMGLVGNGGYNMEDVDYAINQRDKIKEKRKELNLIKDRLNNYLETKTLDDFLITKISYTWGDGTFYAPNKLLRNPYKLTSLHRLFDTNSVKGSIFYYLCTSYYILFLIFIFISTFIDKKNIYSFISRLSLCGLFIFLLIWETRSRYLVNYIPIFIFASLGSINYLFNKKSILLKERREKMKDNKKVEKEDKIANFIKSALKLLHIKVSKKIENLFIQIFKFSIVGVAATLIDFIFLYIFKEFFNLPVIISNTLSFCISVVYNYWASVHWVFNVDESKDKKKNFITFIIFSIIGLGINDLIMWLMINKLSIYYMLSKIVATLIVMIFNFITRKLFLE